MVIKINHPWIQPNPRRERERAIAGDVTAVLAAFNNGMAMLARSVALNARSTSDRTRTWARKEITIQLRAQPAPSRHGRALRLERFEDLSWILDKWQAPLAKSSAVAMVPVTDQASDGSCDPLLTNRRSWPRTRLV
ncbi:MAG: hypothetical protein Q6373_011885 [Candidatus Sigynarchaeota archaeon]